MQSRQITLLSRALMSGKTRKGKAEKKVKPKTVFEYSAGGVVRRDNEVLIVRTKDLKGNIVFTLPKGLLDRDETSEEAALREVREETGYRCRIVDELPRSEYFYRHGDHLVRKTVRWFLMEPLEKEGEHDHEIDEVRWAPIEEALERLAYESDRKLIQGLAAGQ